MTMEQRLAARQTPAGRRYEVNVAQFHDAILILGIIGIATAFPPIVYAAAVGHLVAGFLTAIVKWFWAVVQVVLILIATGLLTAAQYAVAVYYDGKTTLDMMAVLKTVWPQQLAMAIVVGGIVGVLFANAGNLDNLREHLDRADAERDGLGR